MIDQKINSFIDKLSSLSPGDRARFKRSAGKPISEGRDTLGLFYSLLPHGVPAFQEETYYMIGTLFPLAEQGSTSNFGDHLRVAQTISNKKGLDRRVEILLDADAAQLPFRLRQAVHFLNSCRVRINYHQLLDDLLQWSHPDRYIQQRWARSYFAFEAFNQKGE